VSVTGDNHHQWKYGAWCQPSIPLPLDSGSHLSSAQIMIKYRWMLAVATSWQLSLPAFAGDQYHVRVQKYQASNDTARYCQHRLILNT